MEYFISTFIIMLICIIALLQDKSYDNGIVLPRPQNKRPYLKNNQLTQCNYVYPTITKEPARFIIDKNESQTEVFVTLLTDNLVNPSIFNTPTTVFIKANPTIRLNISKNVNSANCFCFQYRINQFTPYYLYFGQCFNKQQDK